LFEDKTGVFTLNEADKEDRSEENTLASIFSKKNGVVPTGLSMAHEKTAVMDRIQAPKPSPPRVAMPVPEEEEDDGQPYYVENTAFKKAVKKRKKVHLREQKIRQMKAQQSRKTFAYVFGGIVLVIFIITVSSYLSYYIVHYSLDFTGITRNEFGIDLEIPPDSTTEQIAEILYLSGIINRPEFFVLYSQLSGYDGKYNDGLFHLESSMSYGTIVRTLQNTTAPRETVWVTIPEGLTAEQVGLLLEENYVCLASDFEKFYREKQNVFSFELRIFESNNKFYQLEGYLFPDTYEFFVVEALRDGEDIDSLREAERQALENYAKTAAYKMFDNFNSMITREMYKTMHEQGLSLDEVITLASMVQAEAAYIEDMRLVASVFKNRMNNSENFPYLQSDPTSYYVRDSIRPHVPSREVILYQAYDTYESPGLPPGPINNPGIYAITAVLEASADSRYFYFNANIETGEVFFAATLAEHEANLARVEAQVG